MQDAKRYADRRHLQWIFDRLVNVHHENPNYDYMHRLKEVIDSYDANKDEVWVPATAVDELKARIEQLTEDLDRQSVQLWAKDEAIRVLAEKIAELEDQ